MSQKGWKTVQSLRISILGFVGHKVSVIINSALVAQTLWKLSYLASGRSGLACRQ